MFNSDFSFGKKERYILYDFCNNNHSTFLEHFKTTSLTVKSISGRGEEKESLKYQVIQISNEALRIQNLLSTFSFQRSPARGLSLRRAKLGRHCIFQVLRGWLFNLYSQAGVPTSLGWISAEYKGRLGARGKQD